MAEIVGDVHTGVHNIMKDEMFTDAKSEPGVMVLDCYADWCGPCKMIAPKIVEFSKTYPNVRFYKIDVDEHPDISQELGIRAMPTIIVFKDGEPAETVVGANPVAIKEAIEKTLAGN